MLSFGGHPSNQITTVMTGEIFEPRIKVVYSPVPDLNYFMKQISEYENWNLYQYTAGQWLCAVKLTLPISWPLLPFRDHEGSIVVHYSNKLFSFSVLPKVQSLATEWRLTKIIRKDKLVSNSHDFTLWKTVHTIFRITLCHVCLLAHHKYWPLHLRKGEQITLLLVYVFRN